MLGLTLELGIFFFFEILKELCIDHYTSVAMKSDGEIAKKRTPELELNLKPVAFCMQKALTAWPTTPQ